jgi:hypothetical protein
VKRGCATDLHPLRAVIEARLTEGVLPGKLAKWLKEQSPDRTISRHILARHRRDHMGLPPFNNQKPLKPRPVEPKAITPTPSQALARDVTDADIEQRLKRRFYDAIDEIPPEKVAELMIEREKAKGRAPAVKVKSGEDVPADVAELRGAAAAALGPKRGRTGLRAVR